MSNDTSNEPSLDDPALDEAAAAESPVAQDDASEQADTLQGMRVALVGKLAGMSRRDAQKLIRSHGGVPVELSEPDVQIAVLGDGESPLEGADWTSELDAAAQRAGSGAGLEVITETELWQRLGLVDSEQDIHQLYTPAMLAELLGVPLAVVRRWHRRGLIVPAREVRRLPYFDFREVATARRMAELLAAGVSPQAIERKLAELARFVPSVARPLAQLSVIVEGKQLLLRQGEGLIAPGGQIWFDFEAAPGHPGLSDDQDSGDAEAGDRNVHATHLPIHRSLSSAHSGTDKELRGEVSDAIPTAADLVAEAASLEEAGQLAAAADLYRAALAAEGPDPQICFALAEILYRLGDAAAARERYYMTIELDEEYVEARANLGCVLAELGERELAVAAFQGALAFHEEYADVHFHLARTLDDLEQAAEADHHWRVFLELAPESPWAAIARLRLADASL
jgi:tetratricopeptide (TPR) repeat protein